jgi:hypothetical protein
MKIVKTFWKTELEISADEINMLSNPATVYDSWLNRFIRKILNIKK